MNTYQIKQQLFKKTGIIYDDRDSWAHYLKFGGVKTVKDVFLDWMRTENENAFVIALTLMPKKIFYKVASSRRKLKRNDVYRHPTKSELLQRASRFVEILNRIVYKNAYKIHGKKLKTMMVVEGEKSLKDLHVHLAFCLPTNISAKEFLTRIHRAVEMSDDFLVKRSDGKKEGGDVMKDLHLELCDGLSTSIATKELLARIHHAVEMNDDSLFYRHRNDQDDSEQLDEEPLDLRYHYKSDICNEGWLTYITKELDEKELKNLYFP